MSLNWERYWIQDYLSHSRALVNDRPPAGDTIRPPHSDDPVPVPWFLAGKPEPRPWLPASNPQPSPWRRAVAELVEAASLKQAAAMLPSGEQRSDVEAGASQAIEDILDEWCGNGRRYPWPHWPHWALPIA